MDISDVSVCVICMCVVFLLVLVKLFSWVFYNVDNLDADEDKPSVIKKKENFERHFYGAFSNA